MEVSDSYVYFALQGDDFDPEEITKLIGISPSESWRKGDKGKFKSTLEFSCWKLSTSKGQEYMWIDKLVNEIIQKLYDKIDIIKELKAKYQLDSVLEIVMEIDVNPENTTPSLGHDLKTIEFLYRTGTKTDIDIYRFDSAKNKVNKNVL
jgi:hypothetical protein